MPGRNYAQLLRFYHTFLRVKGSYTWAAYMEDPDAIEAMLAIPESEWSRPGPPALFGWTDVIDKLTDLGDQLIANRARDNKVKFYPRPRIPAIEERKHRNVNKRDDMIERARQKSKERRAQQLNSEVL